MLSDIPPELHGGGCPRQVKSRTQAVTTIPIKSGGDMKRCLFAVLCALAAASALAQDAYPSRPITMIVPFPPGGVADITGRPTAAAMEKILKQPVAVVNRPGAGGAVGKAAVANAKPE